MSFRVSFPPEKMLIKKDVLYPERPADGSTDQEANWTFKDRPVPAFMSKMKL